MNYYPFYSGLPSMATKAASTGIFSNLFKGLSLGKILTGSQKTLSFVNQTLPLIRQAKPMLNNFKTMMKVMNEFKKVDNVSTQNTEQPPIIKEKNTQQKNERKTEITEDKEKTQTYNGLTFFQ